MNEWVGVGGIALILPVLLWYWSTQLRSAWVIKKQKEDMASNSGRPSHQEDVEQAGLALFRDGVLATLTIGGAIIGLITLLSRANKPGVEESEMAEIVQRGIIAVLAFAIIYGLSVAVVPEILPDKGTRRSRILSETIAILVAAVFAISAGTTDSIYDSIHDNIVSNASKVLATFIGILFAAIGVFLVWKRVKTLAKPVGHPESRGPLGRETRDER